jgi:uncharacterized protein DUF6046
MHVKLGNVDLAVGSTDDGERHEELLKTILSISIKDKRNLVEQQIPGSSGNHLQDTGPEPVQISLEGEINGEKASEAIQDIYKIFEAGKTLSFHSDLAAIANVTKVNIESFQVDKAPGSAFHYGYKMELKEHIGK